MKRGLYLAVMVALTAAVPGWAAKAPIAVSPGSDTGSLIESRCPTFSWGAVEGSKAYELVVYRVTANGKEAERVLHHKVPGAALSWTPSLSRCLDTESRYGWAVRAVGEGFETRWSEERLFRVARSPDHTDAAAALAVLGRFLADGGRLEELAERDFQPAVASRWSQREEDPPSLPSPSGVGTKIVAVPQPVVGLSSEVGTESGYLGGAIGARGEWTATDDPGRTAGYLGVATGSRSTFDGFPWPSSFPAKTGVLGIATGFFSYGVVGVGNDSTLGAGYFFSTDSSGERTTAVTLGSSQYALSVWGDSTFSEPPQLPYIGAHESSGDFGPEVYKITDSVDPTCTFTVRGSIAVMRLTAVSQDALCFCGYALGSYDWWCFNP